MREPFSDTFKEIADSMGIAMYQRFSVNEASLFLHYPEADIKKLMSGGKISFIKVTKTESQFFGFQLLEYLLENTVQKKSTTAAPTDMPERILRTKEVTQMTGLSRTTIWRMERKGDFPDRVQLGVGSVGWRMSEVSAWMNEIVVKCLLSGQSDRFGFST